MENCGADRDCDNSSTTSMSDLVSKVTKPHLQALVPEQLKSLPR